MNKMLVAVFDTENQAYEGMSALKELHKSGDITLYATAVVSKDEKGEMKLNTSADQGPIGTTTGLFAGSLIGLLGGPVGVMVGAATGSVTGLVFDVNTNDINSTFVDEVSNALTPGKTAVIAEIDETWTVPVDTKLEALNGMVFRRLQYEVVDDQLERESKAIAEEYKSLNEELKEAKDEDKPKIEAAIVKLRNKARATNELIVKELNESKSQYDAKVNKMEEQMKDAKERKKARIGKRLQEVKDEYQKRTDRLNQASRMISVAMGSNA